MKILRQSFATVRRAAEIWLQSNAFALAGSLAFFTLFSVAPVVIVLVSIVGIFFGEQAAEGQIVGQLEQAIGSQAAEAVQSAVAASRLEDNGVWATAAGVLAMLVGATTVFGQMQTALNAIWEVAPRPSHNSFLLLLRKRIISLTLVLTIGLVMLSSVLLSVGLNAALRYLEGWVGDQDMLLRVADLGLSLTVVTALFALIFRTLPDVRLRWRDVFFGAFVTALLFGVGRLLIALYLTHTATASTFGAAGSLVILLLWVNYSSLILLYGAALTRARFESRGGVVHPSSVAVRVRRHFVEDGEELA